MPPITISDAESVVMQALWQAGEATAEDLVAAVAAPNGWAEATVRTLLNRLLTKGAVSADREGRRYRYRPVSPKCATSGATRPPNRRSTTPALSPATQSARCSTGR